MSRALAVHGPGVPCGLPSPGSRRQSTGFYDNNSGRMRPADPTKALVAAAWNLITCKRCKRAMRAAARTRAAARKG